jgi:AcrR family transcriptional regulator
MVRQSSVTTSESGRGEQTRIRLLEASIQLFARHGIQGVSLRTVMDAAGAKNTAAVHYHFGDREALLKAGLDCVTGALGETVSLDEAAGYGFSFADVTDDETSALRLLITLAMLPLITLPQRRPWGMDGVKLLARIVMGEAQDLAPQLEANMIAETQQIIDLLHRYMPSIPESILRDRLDFAFINLVCGIAAMPYLSAIAGAGLTETKAPADLARSLIDYILGGLSAPVS